MASSCVAGIITARCGDPGASSPGGAASVVTVVPMGVGADVSGDETESFVGERAVVAAAAAAASDEALTLCTPVVIVHIVEVLSVEESAAVVVEDDV